MPPTKKSAYLDLLQHFVRGPALQKQEERDAVIRSARAIFAQAEAEYDDVTKEELLAACATLCPPTEGEGGRTKRDAFNALKAYKDSCMQAQAPPRWPHPYPRNWVDSKE